MGFAPEHTQLQEAGQAMSEANSPMYALGREDAIADNEAVANGLAPLGPRPPYPDYRVMYDRGYQSVRG